MGIFDRFKKRFETVGKDRGVKHAVKPKGPKAKADEEKKKQFAAVPSGKSDAALKSEAKSKKEPKAREPKASGIAHRVLRKAVVTEKSTRLSGLNKIVFDVDPAATKHAVAQAVSDLYGIKAVSVRMVNLPSKFIRYGRSTGRTRAQRKAIVTVPEGKRITVAEGV